MRFTLTDGSIDNVKHGVRLGALPIFRLGHLTKIDNLYKLKVYGTNKKDKYYTFSTPNVQLLSMLILIIAKDLVKG